MACQVFPETSFVDVVLPAHRARMVGRPSLGDVRHGHVCRNNTTGLRSKLEVGSLAERAKGGGELRGG